MGNEKRKKGESILKSFSKSFSLIREDDELDQNDNFSAEEEARQAAYVAPSSVQEDEQAASSPAQVAPAQKLTAYITPGQVVNGSIVLSDDIVIDGEVNGDIISSGNILLKGKVIGNIKSNNIEIVGATVVGNVEVSSNINMVGCNIEGNIAADNIDINGRITGNVSASSVCSIHENAVVNGDVASEAFVVKKNAVINGTISMHKSAN